jgi:hypothetical protein
VRRQETLPPSGHVAEEAESALAERDKLFNSLTKKLSNAELIKYVNETSPWRDPMKWPANVIPTKHPKSNIMKSPQDPNNPYIFQPQFAAPRMDMYFRRPNLPTSGGKKKGQYVPDDRDFLRHEYTVPYFPEVVDVNMTPQPWAFVGSTDAYFEKSGGRALGLTLMNQAVAHQVNPLSNNPVPQSLPLLAEELKKLEEKRYGAPIAFLRPIGAASHDKKSLPAVEAPSQAGVAQEASGTRPAALRGESDMVHEDLSAPPL